MGNVAPFTIEKVLPPVMKRETATRHHHGRVIRATRLRCRELPEGRGFKPGSGHPATGCCCLSSLINSYVPVGTVNEPNHTVAGQAQTF